MGRISRRIYSGLYIRSNMELYAGEEKQTILLLPLLLALTALGVIGDLFESLMKRHAGIKNSGNILPGHGGILDRIDALTSTLPIATLTILISTV